MGISLGAGHRTAATNRRVREGAQIGALWGLAARGLLYLALAVLALDLVFGGSGSQVDARGALHDLAHDPLGGVLLGILVVGFAGFALWHLWLALHPRSSRARSLPERAANGARAAVYAALCAFGVSFLVTSASSGDADREDKTWTAKLLDLTGGEVIVGAIALGMLAAGGYLLWRAFFTDEQDEAGVLEASPRDTPLLRGLARAGNVARGAVVVLLGAFLLHAAIDHDAEKTVGLDGALRRLLDGGLGDVAVAIVAAGFALFGVYSLARVWVNRDRT